MRQLRGKAGPSLRYYEPLGLPPGTIRFRRRLIRTAFARLGRRDGPLLFRIELLSACRPPYPAGVLHRSGPALVQSVAFAVK